MLIIYHKIGVSLSHGTENWNTQLMVHGDSQTAMVEWKYKSTNAKAEEAHHKQ